MRCKDFGWHPDCFLYISFCSEQAHLSNESWTYVAHSWGWEGLRNTEEKMFYLITGESHQIPFSLILGWLRTRHNYTLHGLTWSQQGGQGCPVKPYSHIFEYPRHALENRGWCKSSSFHLLSLCMSVSPLSPSESMMRSPETTRMSDPVSLSLTYKISHIAFLLELVHIYNEDIRCVHLDSCDQIQDSEPTLLRESAVPNSSCPGIPTT